jgi:hypothetical protein
LASIRSLLLSFSEGGKLPRIVSTVLISEFHPIITNIFEWVRKKLGNISFRYLVWGVIILIGSEILSGLVNGSRIKERFQYLVPWEGKPITNPLIVSLPLYNYTDNVAYLKDCVSITNQLKAAGAKAVVIDFSGIRPNSSALVTEQIQKLRETGMVIFADDPSRPAYGTNIPLSDFSIDKDVRRIGTVHRLTLSWYGANPDVLVELLRQYHNYSPNEPVRLQKNVVRFGDYEIPTDGAGSFYMDLNTQRIVSHEQIEPVYLIRNRNSGTIEYWFSSIPNTIDSVGSPLAEKYGRRYKGKFVFLMNGFIGLQSVGTAAGSMYAVAFANLLERQYFLQSKWLHLALSAVFLLLIGAICRWLRLSITIPLLLILAGGSLYFVDWLLHIHHIYVQTFPFMLSVYSGALIFPLLRFLRDHRKENEPASS